jgi:hypothetical protein
MLKYKAYFYYSKNDSKKEAIDKIIAISYEDALQFFIERKQMDEYTFLNLFEIEENEIESK